MDSLPGHLLDKVLFRIDLRSLAMMRCTNKALQSHTQDLYFVSEYSSRIRPDLLYISAFRSDYLCYVHHHLHGGSRSLKPKDILKCHILGVCSGLLLLSTDDNLCVANPLTKKFRFLNHSNHQTMCLSTSHLRPKKTKQLGLAVNKIDRTNQSFKLVYIFEMGKNNELTTYGFEINPGNSWRYSQTTITCHSSDLDHCMKDPVYFDGSLHWLRNDGSIIAFNPETEQARLIPIKFPQGLSSETGEPLFASGDNNLTLIPATREVTYVYALENTLNDPKWVLVTQILNEVLDQKTLEYWKVEAYDGKCLVLREDRREKDIVYDQLYHIYDLSANKWVVSGWIPAWCGGNRDTFQFTPSLSSVVRLDEILASGDRRISTLSSIMALIGGISTENVEKQLRKRSAEEEEKKLILVKNMESSGELLYDQNTNKKRRVV